MIQLSTLLFSDIKNTLNINLKKNCVIRLLSHMFRTFNFIWVGQELHTGTKLSLIQSIGINVLENNKVHN